MSSKETKTKQTTSFATIIYRMIPLLLLFFIGLVKTVSLS